MGLVGEWLGFQIISIILYKLRYINFNLNKTTLFSPDNFFTGIFQNNFRLHLKVGLSYLLVWQQQAWNQQVENFAQENPQQYAGNEMRKLPKQGSYTGYKLQWGSKCHTSPNFE